MIDELADAIASTHQNTHHLALVGIANGGIPLALDMQKKLEKKMGRSLPLGTVNISFQRDDIGRNPIPKMAEHTSLPFAIDQSSILLIDDVLFTGRTVRAGMNEIFDQGRPARIELAILYDRGDRRLPIEPNFKGFSEKLDPRDTVKVHIDPEDANHHRIDILPHEQRV